MRVLELFKGTGSVGKVCNSYGYTVTSLDIDSRFNPDICCDIMEWDYKALPSDSFDLIWASPLCTYYSCMQQIWVSRNPPGWLEGKRVESDKMIQRVLDIVAYFKPKYWFMENPQTGDLKNRDVVKGLSFVDADYCKYGYPYKKRTRFWGTVEGLTLLKCKFDCPFSDGNRHSCAISRRTNSVTTPSYKINPQEACASIGKVYNLEMRYSIPEDLLREIIPKQVQVKIKPLITKKGGQVLLENQAKVKVSIKPSPIHGLGVFAEEPIKAGTRIAYYEGVPMMYSEIKAKYGDDMTCVYRTMPWLPQIVSKEHKNLINFVNDGVYGQPVSKVNCILSKRWLSTFEDIGAGEELTLQYPANYFKHIPK